MKLIKLALLTLIIAGCVALPYAPKFQHTQSQKHEHINYYQILSTWAQGLHKGIYHQVRVEKVTPIGPGKLAFMVEVIYNVDEDWFWDYHAVVITDKGIITHSEQISVDEPTEEEKIAEQLRHEV